MDGLSDSHLSRKIGLFSASGIVVANMIGAGIFTTSGLLMSGLNSPVALILLWITGGIVALCGALAYAELGKAMPEAGGEYFFLSRLYHPLAGFLSGWVSFVVGFSAPIAASAIGFSEYFFSAFPQLTAASETGGFISSNLSKILAVGVVLVFSGIHLRGLTFGAIVQNYLTLLKILLILVLIFAGFYIGKGSFAHLTEKMHIDVSFSGIKTMGLSLMWIMFAYSGWNASTYIGSEIRRPQRNIPLSLLTGTAIVMVLYVLLNLLFIYAIPPDEMMGVIAIGALAVRNLFGSSAEMIFSLLIAFALFSSLSAFIILGPRVYYSMAADGYFFKFVSRINQRFKVPSGAILLQAGLAIIMVLSGTFDQILTYMGFALGCFPILAVAGVFKLRKTGKIPKKHWTSSLYLFIYLLFGVTILVLSYLERPVESSIALLTVLTGVPVFYLFKRLR
jgi:APA family basic amino acid/polyamine antiporter